MKLTVKEAATRLGMSPRGVRSALHAGRLKGYKQHGRWVIPSQTLLLDARQRAARQEKADAIRAVVEDALPSRVARDARRRKRSVVDLEPFQAMHALLVALRGTDEGVCPDHRAAVVELNDALLALGEAHVVFAPAAKAAAYDLARRAAGRVVAALAPGRLVAAAHPRSQAQGHRGGLRVRPHRPRGPRGPHRSAVPAPRPR